MGQAESRHLNKEWHMGRIGEDQVGAVLKCPGHSPPGMVFKTGWLVSANTYNTPCERSHAGVQDVK